MLRAAQRGSTLAWTAVFLGLVLVPLLMLIGDGARLLYVRARLATATDAACENAAWSTAGRPNWQWYSDDRFLQTALLQAAQTTFYQMLAEQNKVQYTPALSVSLDSTHTIVACSAQARVPLLVTLGQEVTMRVRVNARMRFAR